MEYCGDFQFYSKSIDLADSNSLELVPNAAKMLSNFYLDPKKRMIITVPELKKTVSLSSVEHAYQLSKCLFACKTNEERKRMINTFNQPDILASAEKAKKAGNPTAYDLEFDTEAWSIYAPTLMKELIQQKIEKNHEISTILKKIAKARLRLVHFSLLDKVWGAERVVQPVSRGDEETTLEGEGKITSESLVNNGVDYDEGVAELDGRNELGNIYNQYILDHYSDK
jgi:predicted NAD-dependent protein-ADP-ribosyltransferase YbiA (DUF1768 family)